MRGGGNCRLYESPLSEVANKAAFYKKNYALYPVLFFYGVGNGVLFKILFQNPVHKLIIVFEKELEILWYVLHLMDFSQQLQNNILRFFDSTLLKDEELDILCANLNIFAKIYHLEPMSAFYEGEDFEKFNLRLGEFFEKSTLQFGNDLDDALMGLDNFTHNLSKMLTHPSLQIFKKAYAKLYKNAIIVSTGPSLSKQLPLLKQVASKAVIFAADSAYSILAKNGIRADFVFMVERTDFTAEFFNNDFKDLDKGVFFICAAVVHPVALAYLEKAKRPYMLAPRCYDFAYYCDFKDFGLVDGVSVAHMAFDLAQGLEFEKIIFIGQDLSFNKEGHSHPKDYLHSSTYESTMDIKKLRVEAYGGEGFVETHGIWLLFKQSLELSIARALKKGIQIYNATEGGARIKGTCEKSFNECCEEFLHEKLTKPLPPLKNASKNKQDEWLLKAFAKLFGARKKCEEVQSELTQIFTHLDYENLDDEALAILSENLDVLKEKILSFRALLEVLRPSWHAFNLSFMRIFVFLPQNKEQKREKILALIKLYFDWFSIVREAMQKQKEILEKNLLVLEEELKERNFLVRITKYKEKAARI